MRIESSRRGAWVDRVVEAGRTVIPDFICPTEETCAAFGEAVTIWLDRIDAGPFEAREAISAAHVGGLSALP